MARKPSTAARKSGRTFSPPNIDEWIEVASAALAQSKEALRAQARLLQQQIPHLDMLADHVESILDQRPK